MNHPKTLLEMAGADLAPARLDEACLVLIDCQNEYLEGPLALPGVAPAIEASERLLARARASRTPVFHVAHCGGKDGPFDRDAWRGAFIDGIGPLPGETVIEKARPNSFADTGLGPALAKTGRRKLIVAGFMTHMCVSATVRAALDLGYMSTIASDACATRDLPDGSGDVIDAGTVHRVALAELADRFAIVARTTDII
ncbi:cysteine hydrolase family protein [Oricola thermophila]|uniref:Cysteine hydrolase n=1 Tax=Oricola thermophila TaxID=2742145 RepID=A0A6N1VKV4_9HYPH|nr:cysteine hydrolase family protein [Oricola thermophila]QKV20425.1 cysteine hydrolase [Oricola thermophila]